MRHGGFITNRGLERANRELNEDCFVVAANPVLRALRKVSHTSAFRDYVDECSDAVALLHLPSLESSA